MELGLVLSILKEGLKLSNTLIDRKYLDRVIELEKDYHNERAKGDDASDLTLDNIMSELETIGSVFGRYKPKE